MKVANAHGSQTKRACTKASVVGDSRNSDLGATAAIQNVHHQEASQHAKMQDNQGIWGFHIAPSKLASLSHRLCACNCRSSALWMRRPPITFGILTYGILK